MTIRLNVKISVSDQGKSVMVWSDEMKDLLGIEEYTGIVSSHTRNSHITK